MSVADKLLTVANNVPLVFAAGKQAEYDAFWDAAQQSGNRTDYFKAFCNFLCPVDWFKPKYIITVGEGSYAPYSGLDQAFYFFNFNGTEPVDFSNVHFNVLDTCTRALNTFASARIKNLTIDLSPCKTISGLFSDGNMPGYIESATLKITENTTTLTNPFLYSTYLKELYFMEGSAIALSFRLDASPLTHDSIVSVINALSSNAAGQTVTFRSRAVNNAFTDSEWATLIASKPNWTFTLA